MNPEPKFSKPSRNSYALTPLGAAYVEAMPDRKVMNAVKRAFSEGRFVTSAIFPTVESIREFNTKAKTELS